MAASLIKPATLAALLLAANAQAAEPLPDPTRPAAEFLAPSAGADAAKAAAAVSTDGVRTIIIAPDRRSAVIDGEQVALGGKLGNERLTAVCEDSVVLQGAEGRRELPLYPGVVIQSNRVKRCNTAGKPVATSAPARKANKTKYKAPRRIAPKKEKSCE